MKYRKKPVIIEAFRFQIDDVMPDWFNEKRITNDIITHEDGTCDIKTLEGTMKANFGDYIIKGVQGEVYPCKPDIFDKTYEKVLEGKKIMSKESEALKRNEPMKLKTKRVKVSIDDYRIDDYCPTCDEELYTTSNYCPHCGQKLDWS